MVKNNKNTNDKLISFPTDFTIKIIGVNNETFYDNIIEIVTKHYPSTDLRKISTSLSKADKYLAITVVVHANSQEELDQLYNELQSHEHSKWVL